MEKLKKALALILAATLFCAFAVGCGGKKIDSEIVGVWVKDNDYTKTTLTLTEKGEISFTASYMGNTVPFIEGTYTVEGNVLTVTYGEETETTEFSIENNVLRLTLLKSDIELTREK